MRRITLVTAWLIVLAAVPPAAGRSADATGSFTSDGVVFTTTIPVVELATMVSVPVENVRPYVPAGFSILGEDAGQAPLFVQIGYFPSLRIDDQEAGDGFGGIVAVGVEAPDGTPGLHRYNLWTPMTVPRLHQKFRHAGLTSRLSRISLDRHEGTALMTATGRVADTRTKDAHSLFASVVQEPVSPLDLVEHELAGGSVFWEQHGDKVTRLTYDIAFHSWQWADALLETTEGSTLAELVGTTSVATPAALIEGHVHGTVEVGTLTAAAPTASPATAAGAIHGVVEVPLTFRVSNVNPPKSRVPCLTDGLDYDVQGWLVAPRSALARKGGAVTLYLHGATGQYWRFKHVPGYDFASEMARLGHASVVIDRLGYNASPTPDGLQVCIGSQASMVRQVVGQLRAGSYTAAVGEPPRFDRVALAGHSAGGSIAQVTAYAFGGVDALVVMGYADQGFSSRFGEEAADAGQVCATGGEPKYGPDGGPGGYLLFPRSDEALEELAFHDVDPAVVDAVLAVRERDACAEGASVLAAVAANQLSLHEVEVPVLLASGAEDAMFTEGSGEAQRDRFTGSDDVSLVVIPALGHSMFLERRAPELRAVVSAWLAQRGF